MDKIREIKISNSPIGVVALNSPLHIQNVNVHPVQQTVTDAQDQDYNVSRTVGTFRGRDDELDKLKTWLFQDNKTKVAICGLPGIGKTELSRQFADRCKKDGLIRTIIWIDAETRESVERSFREVRERLGGGTENNIRDVIRTVHEHYRGNKHMFIFDNAVDRQTICEFEPLDACVCVVTSHVKRWGQGMVSLPLTTLSVSGAIDVLHAVLEEYFCNDDEEQYQILVDLLSCVPLALQVAAAFLREEFEEAEDLGEQYMVQDYIQQLQNSCEKVITETIPESIPNSYDKSVSQAVEISLFKIKNSNKPHSKLACDILNICAYLNSGKILHEDLVNILQFYNKKQNSHDIQKACALLCKYSFITYDNKQICIHRLIQSTLVIHQTNLFQNTCNPFYLSCLQYLLEVSNIAKLKYHRHRYYILKQSKEHLYTFKIFLYSFVGENINNILTKSLFVHYLVIENCEIFLTEIFNALGKHVADYISKYNLLNVAIEYRQYDMMELLLGRGANVEGNDEYTCLMCAAHNVDIKAMRILLSYKANFNATWNFGMSILHILTTTLWQPQNIFKFNEVREGIQMLVKHGASIDVVDDEKRTLLHIIASSCNAELVSYLVCSYELDVNAVDIHQHTPLFHVCYPPGIDIGRRIETAWTLLKLGANLHVSNKSNQTPAELAHSRGLVDLAAFLENPSESYSLQTSRPADELKVVVANGDLPTIIQKLNELDQQLANQSCLLHIAIKCENFEVLKMLLERGIEVNTKDDTNNTALHIAADGLDLNAMKELVQHGADINAINSKDNSVFHNLLMAGSSRYKPERRNNEHFAAVRWLLAQGVRTDTEVSTGGTMLHTAALGRNADLVRFLVTEYNLNVNVVDIHGFTPIVYVYMGLPGPEKFRLEDEEQALVTVACLVEFGAQLDLDDVLRQATSAIGIEVKYAKLSQGYKRLAAFINKAEAYIQQLTDKDSSMDTQNNMMQDNPAATRHVQPQQKTLATIVTATAVAAIAMGAWWLSLVLLDFMNKYSN